ncbi:MAG: aspartate aminotransferase family protein [Candidatus Omnitrophica bacterium]|nr:aspartate aminotransferase family protein [Candidatus Omnitrophota bacterium]
MKTSDIQKLYTEYILPTYTQVPVCLVKGKGSKVWDLQGKEYIDFFPGWAVSGLGHCHPDVVHALKHQIGKILHISNNFLNLKQAQLAQEISRASFPSRLFFCNSGAEAAESAVKFARKYGSETGRYEIITMRQSFHGRTLAALTLTGQEKVQKGFEPLPSGFRYAELNNLLSVAEQVTDKTIAIFLEPVQGEGGVNVATPEFMTGLRQICDKKDLLLILDEVQTGMGRTGKMFAYQHYGLEPDVMILAKSLGSGVPIGALVVNKKIKKEVFTPGTHGSTYGGNPLVASASIAVFKAIRKGKLVSYAARLGDYFGKRLEAMKSKYPVIQAVRGLAMMRGLELNVPGAAFADKAREKGLLINCTQEKILRLMPAINISKTLLDEGLDILEKVFNELLTSTKR